MFKAILLAGAAACLLTGAAFAGGRHDASAAWDGYYVGADLGYGPGTFSDAGAGFADTTLAGGFVGGQAGYNFALVDGVVFGIEADLNWANGKGTSADIPSGPGGIYHSSFTDDLTWNGAVTAHLGPALGPVLPYLVAGVAAAGSTLHNVGNDFQGAFEADESATHVGWTAGIGVAGMMGPLSTFIEYRYSDYGTATYAAVAPGDPVRIIDNSVRIGANYHMQ